LGAVQQRLYWNWEAALQEFRAARDYQPGLSLARHRLGGLLSNLGRHDEAMVELSAAREIDPLSPPVHTALGAALMRSGRIKEAVRQLELTVAMEPGYASASYLLAQAYVLDGRQKEAESCIANLLGKDGESPLHQALHAYVLAAGGNSIDAVALLERLEAAWTKKYFPPYALAQAYTGLNHHDKAMEWLETAYRKRDPSVVILKVDPLMAALRDRAEYRELVRKLKL
jgi:predicted Zn-dependent protease